MRCCGCRVSLMLCFVAVPLCRHRYQYQHWFVQNTVVEHTTRPD